MTAATASARTPAPPVASSLSGTGELVRLAWRRDRVMLPVWWLGLVALAVGSAQATRALYPDEAAVQTDLGAVIDNPSVLALYGPLGAPTIDAFSVFKTVMLGAVFVSILGLTVVRRHTRAEEDDGRVELVGSGVVSRRAPLTAAVVLGVLAVVVPSVLAGLGLAAIGQDPVGSAAFAVAWMTPGLATVGLTALLAQVAGTSRTTSGLAFGLVGACYLVRAVGDVQGGGAGHVLTWVSPLGWTGQVSAYGQNRFWVLLLGIGLGAAATAAAYVLLGRRDLGAGLLAARPGPARARRLGSALALTTRLARGTVIGWTVGIVVGGGLIATLLPAVARLADNSAVSEVLASIGGGAGTVEDLFVATETTVVAALVAAAGLALALRLAGSEAAGFSESVLATATGRGRWFAAHAVTGLALPAWLMLAFGAVLGTLARPVAGNAAPGFWETVAAALATLPAVWVVVATGLALVGVSPRLRPLAWVLLLVWLVVGEFGNVLGLPEWALSLSPFHHVGSLPGGEFSAPTAAVLMLLAAGLLVVGTLGHARRDIG